jgi:ABC-2 type transport system permease protein
MGNFFRGIIRASAFLRKEIFEILRQPRLVATLVVGPFLILFIFGIGYRAQSTTLRTLFVVQPDSPISVQEIQQYLKSMGTLLIYAGDTPNLSTALERLQYEQVDLVFVEPENTSEIFTKNQQAVFTLYHHAIDPTQVAYINYLGWLFASSVNQQVLRSFAEQGQHEAASLKTSLQEAHQNVAGMRTAVQVGDDTLANQKQQAVTTNIGAISQAAGAGLGLLDSLQQTNLSNGSSPDLLQTSLSGLQQNASQLGDSSLTKDERLNQLDKIDKNLTDLESKLAVFQQIDPYIIVSPFRSDTKGLARVQPSIADFFAPAVLALLLQHLAVTFAALSIVRERNVGTMELFRVSPLSAAEALFGKYISYLLLGGVLAAILAALLVFVLGVPMLGNWWNFALVIATVLFSSLGIGFIISIVSQTDSQAVQYSMIILLASVFFSGFILSLEMLWEPVRVISWLLPTTYGTLLLRDIALRGADPNWWLLGGLLAIGFVLMLLSWQLMRRLIVSSQ